MSDKKTEKLIISKDGVARGIHGPLVAAISQALGEVRIMRASHVEPGTGLSQAALGNLPIKYLDLARCEEVPGSHVMLCIDQEYATKWFADMSPVQLGIILGPFDDREIALKEEVAWLLAHNIPVCAPCRGT